MKMMYNSKQTVYVQMRFSICGCQCGPTPFMRRRPKRIRLAKISTVYSCQKLYGDYFRLTHSCGNSKIIMSGKHTQDTIQVSKGAKIRNRYNQVPHMTQDTNGKVTNS